jgi:hypothetical protein
LATVAGNEVRLLLQVSAIAVGLGAVVERSTAVYIYLGVQAVRHRKDLALALDQAA